MKQRSAIHGLETRYAGGFMVRDTADGLHVYRGGSYLATVENQGVAQALIDRLRAEGDVSHKSGRLTRSDLTVEKARPSGAWIVQAMVKDRHGEHLAVRQYQGYSKRDAEQAFLDEFSQGTATNPPSRRQAAKAKRESYGGEPLIGYDGHEYEVGDRIELHPGTDLWMKGARYGEVIGVSLTKKDRVRVRLDKMPDRVLAGEASDFKSIEPRPGPRAD